jgi:hypothetical protein
MFGIWTVRKTSSSLFIFLLPVNVVDPHNGLNLEKFGGARSLSNSYIITTQVRYMGVTWFFVFSMLLPIRFTKQNSSYISKPTMKPMLWILRKLLKKRIEHWVSLDLVMVIRSACLMIS